MINLVHAVVNLMQLQGAHVENAVADQLGLYALLRTHETTTACASAMSLLRDLVQTSSVQLTGKCHGEQSRRRVSAIEAQDYYLDIGAGKLTWPPGGDPSNFPEITGLLVSANDLAKAAASSPAPPSRAAVRDVILDAMAKNGGFIGQTKGAEIVRKRYPLFPMKEAMAFVKSLTGNEKRGPKGPRKKSAE